MDSILHFKGLVCTLLITWQILTSSWNPENYLELATHLKRGECVEIPNKDFKVCKGKRRVYYEYVREYYNCYSNGEGKA